MANTLRITPDYALHQGVLPDTVLHSHGAIALLVSMAEEFELHLPKAGTSSSTIVSAHSALVDAGVKHALIAGHVPVQTLYIEGHTPLARYLRRHYLYQRKVVTEVLPPYSPRHHQRLIHEMNPESLFRQYREAKQPPLDERIRKTLSLLPYSRLTVPGSQAVTNNATDIAGRLGLSSHRFSHLFREQMGLSFRQYRLWSQLAGFIRTLPQAASLTDHALAHDFWDSSHLSNTFRKQLGLRPSDVIKPLRSSASGIRTIEY